MYDWFLAVFAAAMRYDRQLDFGTEWYAIALTEIRLNNSVFGRRMRKCSLWRQKNKSHWWHEQIAHSLHIYYEWMKWLWRVILAMERFQTHSTHKRCVAMKNSKTIISTWNWFQLSIIIPSCSICLFLWMMVEIVKLLGNNTIWNVCCVLSELHCRTNLIHKISTRLFFNDDYSQMLFGLILLICDFDKIGNNKLQKLAIFYVSF